MISLRARQIGIFVLGWTAYGATYLLRKPIGVIKSDLETDLHYSNKQLGMLDSALLFPYAFMQMILGPVGDKFGARKTFGFSLILAALSMCTFGQHSNLYVFMFLLFVNGTAQSQCWPNCSKALGSWFADASRDKMFGLFGTCAFVGGAVGSALAVMLQSMWGWRSCFFMPSVILGLLGGLVLLFFSQPNELGIEVPGKAGVNTKQSGQQKALTFKDISNILTVKECALALFCLKVIRYAMFMWLPMYLLHALNYTKAEAGLYATVFEIGGVAGSALMGFLLERLFQGRTLYGTAVMMAWSTICLVLYIKTSDWGFTVNSVLMFMAGAFNCGPDTVLSGSFPALLGEMDGRNAAASVVGFVNGFGTIGTVLEGPIIGFISDQYGWSGMFVLMIILSLVGTLSAVRANILFERNEAQKAQVRLTETNADQFTKDTKLNIEQELNTGKV